MDLMLGNILFNIMNKNNKWSSLYPFLEGKVKDEFKDKNGAWSFHNRSKDTFQRPIVFECKVSDEEIQQGHWGHADKQRLNTPVPLERISGIGFAGGEMMPVEEFLKQDIERVKKGEKLSYNPEEVLKAYQEKMALQHQQKTDTLNASNILQNNNNFTSINNTITKSYNNGKIYTLTNGDCSCKCTSDEFHFSMTQPTHSTQLFFSKEGNLQKHLDCQKGQSIEMRQGAKLFQDINPAETQRFVDNEYKKPHLNQYEIQMEFGGKMTVTEFEGGFKEIKMDAKDKEMGGPGKGFHNAYLINKEGKLIHVYENGRIRTNEDTLFNGDKMRDDTPPVPPMGMAQDIPPSGITQGGNSPPPPPNDNGGNNPPPPPNNKGGNNLPPNGNGGNNDRFIFAGNSNLKHSISVSSDKAIPQTAPKESIFSKIKRGLKKLDKKLIEMGILNDTTNMPPLTLKQLTADLSKDFKSLGKGIAKAFTPRPAIRPIRCHSAEKDYGMPTEPPAILRKEPIKTQTQIPIGKLRNGGR